MLTRRVSLRDHVAAQVLAEYLAMRRETWPAARGTWDVAFPDPDAYEDPRGAFVLAVHDGQVVGCGGLRLVDVDRVEIKHVYLRESARGQGWGRTLLAGLEREAVRLGAETVVLDTNDTLAAANALYRSAGYREIERYNDNPHATRWYAKRLPPP